MPGSRVPAALRARLGDEATFGLIELLDTEQKAWSAQVLDLAGNRFERRLTEELSSLRVEVRDGMASVRQELATTRVEFVKWSFLFWAGEIAALAGVVGAMFKLTGR